MNPSTPPLVPLKSLCWQLGRSSLSKSVWSFAAIWTDLTDQQLTDSSQFGISLRPRGWSTGRDSWLSLQLTHPESCWNVLCLNLLVSGPRCAHFLFTSRMNDQTYLLHLRQCSRDSKDQVCCSLLMPSNPGGLLFEYRPSSLGSHLPRSSTRQLV